MKLLDQITALLRQINTKNIGKLGASLVAASGATQLPPVQSSLDLIHDGGKTKGSINMGAGVLFAIGSALCYFGRPVTVLSDEPVPGAGKP